MTQARFVVDGPVCNECAINPSCLITTALLTILACPCLWIEVSVAKGGAWGEQDIRGGVDFQITLLSGIPVSCANPNQHPRALTEQYLTQMCSCSCVRPSYYVP